MEKVQMFWEPVGFELDSLGTTNTSGFPTAGDTSYVHTSIRMPSLDTLANHCLAKSNAPDPDSCPRVLAGWIDQGMASNKPKLCDLFLFTYLYMSYFMKGGNYG